jgi:ribosomal protein S24E
MEAKITKRNKNVFLHREEIAMEVLNEISPSFAEIKKEIGGDENLVVVKKIEGNFGRQSFSAQIFVYEDEASKNKIEVIPQKVRKKLADEKKAAAGAAK